MTPNNRTNFLWWVLIGPIMILISCTPEPTTIKLNSPEQPQTTASPISTPRKELSDQSLELLQRIELLEQQLNESQKKQTPPYSTYDNPTTSSNKQNGAGLSSNNENTNAKAVSAFSPPDNKWILLLRFPGG